MLADIYQIAEIFSNEIEEHHAFQIAISSLIKARTYGAKEMPLDQAITDFAWSIEALARALQGYDQENYEDAEIAFLHDLNQLRNAALIEAIKRAEKALAENPIIARAEDDETIRAELASAKQKIALLEKNA